MDLVWPRLSSSRTHLMVCWRERQTSGAEGSAQRQCVDPQPFLKTIINRAMSFIAFGFFLQNKNKQLYTNAEF